MVDAALAGRLERAEATANAAFVEARHRVEPGIGAAWTEVASVYAMFDGVGSPITQTFGLGLFDDFGPAEFDRVETFFRDRGADTCHEVSSFAAPRSLGLLAERGYSPIEASAVLIRETANAPAAETRVVVRPIDRDEAPTWSRLSATAWSSESPEIGPFVERIGAVVANAHGATCFLAELDGKPVAAGALYVANDVALLAGAATIPSARRQGAQLALLQARLQFAAARGIALAMVVTQPGSASQRNAERRGFRPVYTRAKWRLETAGRQE